MNEQSIRLIDSRGRAIATAHAAIADGTYSGTIDFSQIPSDLLPLFRDFEEAVNQQLFSHVDELDKAIESLGVRARFDGGFESAVTDLQIFPSVGEFSFRLSATIPTPIVNPVKDAVAIPRIT